jgi:malate dehydrogenase (oxaloacetate-decarboxylating)
MSPSVAPSVQYTTTVRLEYPHEPGWLARITTAIAEHGASIGSVDLVHIRGGLSLRDVSVECASTDHAHEVVRALSGLDGLTVHSVSDETFLMHLGGKLEVRSKVKLKTRADLSMAYTPGVARVCKAIASDTQHSFNLTIRKNCIAIVSDGSAVLGLGDIGPEAAMPVMEGKAVLFKQFGGVDAFPLCVASKDVDEIIRFCKMVAPTFGGINLEDISAPRCFQIEETLKRDLDIPVFHDDQHGTAVVVLAAMINALKIVNKHPQDIKVVLSGAGAAGVACTKILMTYGVTRAVVCDSKGAIHRGRSFTGNPTKAWLAEHTNPDNEQGQLSDVIRGADVFVGVSQPNVMTVEDVRSMSSQPIIFAMSNPDPEIAPDEIQGIATVIGTGRSDYPNQINNVLAFPGIFRGALSSRARDINEAMKHAAAEAIASVIVGSELSPDYVIPSIFDRRVTRLVAGAVAKAAERTGVARRTPKSTIAVWA